MITSVDSFVDNCGWTIWVSVLDTLWTLESESDNFS